MSAFRFATPTVQPSSRRAPLLAGFALLTLTGGARAADPSPAAAAFAKPPLAPATAALVSRGGALYAKYACDYCHGPGAEHWTASLPDLRRATAATYDEFNAIVIDGSRVGRGMPRFAAMSAEEAQAIRAYVLDRAWAAYRAQAPDAKP